MWFTSKFTLSAHSVWLAMQWPSVMVEWQRIEQTLPAVPVQKRRNSPFTQITLMVVVISVIIFSWVPQAIESTACVTMEGQLRREKRLRPAYSSWLFIFAQYNLFHFIQFLCPQFWFCKKFQSSIHWAYRSAYIGQRYARTVRNSRRLYSIN